MILPLRTADMRWRDIMRHKRDKTALKPAAGQTVGAAITGAAAVVISVFVFGWLLSKFDAGSLILTAVSAVFICVCCYFAGSAGAAFENRSSAVIGIVFALGALILLMITGTLMSHASDALSLTTKVILAVVAGTVGALCSPQK